MTDTGPVVCATDLSTSGAEAVELAARLAAATGRRLDLVYVTVADPETAEVQGADEVMRVWRDRLRARQEAARDGIEREVTRAKALGAEAQAVLLHGRPWEAVIAHAESAEASILVVGAHGGSGVQRTTRRDLSEFVLGSTADRVLRHAPCPVLVSPRGEHGKLTLDGSFLVAVDFSDQSRAALRLANALAVACQTKLVVCHVALEQFPDEHSEAPAALTERARAHLLGFVKGELGESADVVIETGPPAPAIALAAEDVGASLIVMGTHGRTGLAHLLLGSVAEKTLRLSAVPVLAVRG